MTAPSPPRCPCGCALAAWSMPWPIAAAPWSPEVVHSAPAVALTTALFPFAPADSELTDRGIRLDLDLIDTEPVTGPATAAAPSPTPDPET